MGSHHHSHRRRRGPRGASLIWLVLAAVAVSALLFDTIGGEQPVPETPQRRYPGTPDSHKSKVLPRTAKEASDHFHRTYDDTDTVYAGDKAGRRSASSDNKPEHPRSQQQAQPQPRTGKAAPAKAAPKPAKPAARPAPASKAPR